MKNYGFVEPVILPEDYTFGTAGQIPDEVLVPGGQWDIYIPEKEIQDVNNVETYNCTGFGASNQIETFLRRRYGGTWNYSDRAIGIAAGTSERGNNPQTVYETIRKVSCMVPQRLLPFSNDIKTIEQFYAPKPLPKSIIREGDQWLNEHHFKHDYVGLPSNPATSDMLMEALKRSPLCVAVYAWAKGSDGLYKRLGRDGHWTMLFGYEKDTYWKIYDSYDDDIKHLAWNFGFYYVKRIWIKKKDQNEQNEGRYSSAFEELWRRLADVFARLWPRNG